MFIQRELLYQYHALHSCATCHRNSHYHYQALRHIRPVLSIPMSSSVAAAIMQSRFDYINSLFYGTSTTNIHKLQCKQNTLSRIVLSNSPYRHLSGNSRLAHLHWLPVDMNIKFKIATLTYKILSTGQPTYLHHLLQPCIPLHSIRSVSQTTTVAHSSPQNQFQPVGFPTCCPYSVEQYST